MGIKVRIKQIMDTWMDTAYDKALKSKTFCIYPFAHLATKTQGSFKLCCRSLEVGSVQKTSAIELWNSNKYKKIRRKLLNNKKPEECVNCWSMEEVGARSMRQRAFKSSRYAKYFDLLEKVGSDGTVPFLPKSIELKLSSLCNLKCRMCHPIDSSSWVKDWPLVSDLMKEHNSWTYDMAKKQNGFKNPIISGFEDNKKWWKDFKELAKSVDLVDFAGGEPLIDPLHYRILDLLLERAPEIKLKYSTNLTRLKFKDAHVFDYWKKFKSVSVYASVDGIGDVYDYIRSGARFKDIESNLDQIMKNQSISFDEIGVACTIQVYNVFQLPEIMDYFSKRGIHFHSHRVTYPAFLNTQVLPRDLKAQASESILEYQLKVNKENLFEEYVIRNLNRHIKDHVNHMNGVDQSHLIPDLVDYTQRLDRIRKTNISCTVPQMKNLMVGMDVASV